MNFIDWENEWEAVFESQADSNFPNDCPIDGMEAGVFEQLYDDYMGEEEKANGVRPDVLTKIPIKTVQKVSPGKVCAICLKAYEVSNKVFFLPCKHHFHIECIKPWFETNHICPCCRFDVNENKPQALEEPN